MTKRFFVAVVFLVMLCAPRAFCGEAPQNGWLAETDGWKTLFLRGTPAERGYAEGYLCAEEIQALFVGFILKNPMVPLPSVWDGVVKQRLLDGSDIPARTRERLDGMIRGMRARDPQWLALEPLHRDLAIEDTIAALALPDFLGLMCSSFACWDSDRNIIGRNLDYIGTRALTSHLMLIVEAPGEGTHGWVSVGWPGMNGCVTGFSDAGLFVALHDVLMREEGKKQATPRLLALASLLENLDSGADTAERGSKRLRDLTLSMGGNCMLAWRSGACVLEFDGRENVTEGVTLRQPGPRNFIVCANHFQERAGVRSACPRYKTLWEQLTDHAGQPRTLADAWPIIRSSSKQDTLYRLVANLNSGDVELERVTAPYSGEWLPIVHFNTQELLKKATTGKAPSPPGTPKRP